MALHCRVQLALHLGVRHQRHRLFSLEVLQDHVRFPQEQLVAEQVTNLVKVNLVEGVVLQWRLESTKPFEDLKEFSLRISSRDV